MAVNITIDLDAAAAFGKIGGLKSTLMALDDDFGDLDFEFDGLDGAIDSVTDLSDALDDVSDKLDGLEFGNRSGSGANIQDLINKAGRVSVATADGGTAGDGRGEPAVGPGKAKKIARGLEGAFDFDGNTLDADTIDGMEIGQVRAEVAEFFFDSQGVTGQRRNLGMSSVPGDFRVNKDGSVGSSRGPNSIGQAMRQSAISGAFGKRGARRLSMAKGGLNMDFVKRWRSRQSVIDRVKRSVGKLDGAFKSAIPSMRTWYRIIAILIPLLITFIVQALGVAAAMLAVAAAGAAVVGLGLVGHGEDMASSWKEAKQQVRELGEALFEVFQPTFQAFAPIQAEVFDRLPGMMTELSQSLRGLTSYEGAIMRMFSGLIGFTSRAVDGMVKYRTIIEELAFKFGSILGDNIAGFFRWILIEAYRNQEALIGLGAALKKLGIALYNVSSIATYFVLTFTPVLNILVGITSILRSKTTVVLLTMVTVLWAAAKVAMFFYSIWKSFIMLKVAFTLLKLVGVTNALTASTLRWAAAIGLATAGLAAVAGYLSYKGMSAKMEHEMATGVGPGGGYGASGGAGGYRGGNTYNDNRQVHMQVNGEMDYATENMVRDTVKSEPDRKSEMNPPDPGTN